MKMNVAWSVDCEFVRAEMELAVVYTSEAENGKIDQISKRIGAQVVPGFGSRAKGG